MKLVEILARELSEWPDECEAVAQDRDKWIGSYTADAVYSGFSWTAKYYFGACLAIGFYEQLSTDHATAFVTREMWESERDRIAIDGQAKKDADAAKAKAGSASKDCWIHNASLSDVMAYRVCEPVIEPVVVANVEAFNAKSEIEPIYNAQAIEHGPLQLRDRIRAIDAQLADLTAERDERIAELAAEGFALLPVADVVEPAGDMEDWRNWQVGDMLEIESCKHWHDFHNGEIVIIESIGCPESDEDCRFKCRGEQDFWFVGESECIFHSRPKPC